MYRQKAHDLIKKWDWHIFNWGSTVTPEFKSFARWFKSLMKTIWDVHKNSFKWNHFETSWFIQLWDEFVYIAISDVRHYQDKWQYTVLYRTATSPTDYTWWGNYYSNLIELKEKIHTLIY